MTTHGSLPWCKPWELIFPTDTLFFFPPLGGPIVLVFPEKAVKNRVQSPGTGRELNDQEIHIEKVHVLFR